MLAKRMPRNGSIGMLSPSHVAIMERYAPIITTMERLGYRVKPGANFQKDTYGYAASAEERASDLNTLVADDDVRILAASARLVHISLSSNKARL